MPGAFEIAAHLDETIQAGLTVLPSDLTPGEIAALIGWNRGRNKAENEAMEKLNKKNGASPTDEKRKERYRGAE